MRQTLTIALCCLLGLSLSACPGKPEPNLQIDPPAPDEFSPFGQAMRSEDGFKEELKQLQAQFTNPPDPGLAMQGDAVGIWKIGSEIEGNEVRLSLENSKNGERWALGVFALPAGDPGPLRIDKSEDKPGGFTLEVSAGEEDELSVSLNARWVQGRYLQLAREIVLNVLDGEKTLSSNATAWSLHGPAVPLRMLPGAGNCYGDLHSADFMKTAQYPRDLMVPAVGAFNESAGFLAMVAHSSIRELNRTYTVECDPSAGKEPTQLARISSKIYDPTKDQYADAYIVAGLPLRDIVVLEPLTFLLDEQEGQETRHACLQAGLSLGTMYRSFVATPMEEQDFGPPSILMAEGSGADSWDTWTKETPAGLKVLVNSDYALGGIERFNAAEWLALRADKPRKGRGKAEQEPAWLLQAHAVNELGQAGLPVFLQCDILSLAPGLEVPAWLDQGGLLAHVDPESRASSQPALGVSWLNLRSEKVGPWILRKAAACRQDLPAASFCWPDYLASPDLPTQPVEQGPYYCSYSAAAAALALRLGVLQQVEGEGATSISIGLPRACCPPYAGRVCMNDSVDDRGLMDQKFAGENFQTALAYALYGVRPYVGLDSTNLAELICSLCDGSSGVVIRPSMQAQSGYEPFLKNIQSVAASAGPLKILSGPGGAGASKDPAVDAAPGVEGGAPAQSFVGMRPAKPQGNSAIFIAFLNATGAVDIDEHNKLIVRWNGSPSGSAEVQLPPGLWKVQNSDPGNIQPGDVAVITKEFLSPPGSDQGNANI